MEIETLKLEIEKLSDESSKSAPGRLAKLVDTVKKLEKERDEAKKNSEDKESLLAQIKKERDQAKSSKRKLGDELEQVKKDLKSASKKEGNSSSITMENKRIAQELRIENKNLNKLIDEKSDALKRIRSERDKFRLEKDGSMIQIEKSSRKNFKKNKI